jgi:hypothetical protein
MDRQPNCHPFSFWPQNLRGKVFFKKEKRKEKVLSVFGVTERPVRARMPRPIYLYHAVRMTDGGFGTLIPAGTDDGWGILTCP